MSGKFDPRNHVGEICGIYQLVDILEEKDKYGHYIYKGICTECGYEKFAPYGHFHGENSATTQCKHLRANGDYIKICKWTNKRIKSIFHSMVSRCYNINNHDYNTYGGKGVVICQEWMDNPQLFEEWALSNGYNDNLTIDRIDSNGNYCPENCQWLPLPENSRKAGKVTWITIGNETLTGRQWAGKLKIGTNTINANIRRFGLSKTTELIAAMLKEPPSTKRRKSKQTWFSVYGIQI